ncbi:alpha/beta-hydrolase [Xylariomycetidae sp. FL2044]|nr:alpha/beta-hydrolase [Xylariomycetidae sp. FL2044]
MFVHSLLMLSSAPAALGLLITPNEALAAHGLNSYRAASPTSAHPASWSVARGADAQVPLAPNRLDAESPERRFDVREQSQDVCQAGSRQWTGWIDVSEAKRLFFWFFESRGNPSTDPVVVWLQGGPAGSSLFGLFQEMGPCLTNEHHNDTVFNRHSWTNFANMLFIDNVGGPDNIPEASEDFQRFLSLFFTDVFPDFDHHPLHIAGESFGGTYVPAFTESISKRQAAGVPTVSKRIESITLVDAALDLITSGSLGAYDHMCRFDENGNNVLKLGLNHTTCREIEEVVPECESLNRRCVESYDRHICEAAFRFCNNHVESVIAAAVPPQRDMYDDRATCDATLPLCGKLQWEEYLNLARVQAALGVDHWNYSAVNFEQFDRWNASKEIYLPTTRELQYILDETSTRVLVVNGNNDILINTEGQKRVYDQQPWSHQAKYRLEKFADWGFPQEQASRRWKKGGEYKSVDRLSFVSVDEAGHTSPGDQREAVAFVMKCWLHPSNDLSCMI